MIRSAVAMAALVGLACGAVGDDKDPVKDKLFAAKVTYDKEMQQYRKQSAEWFDKREDAARKDGNKKLLDQTKGERESFDETGELPKTVPASLKQKPVLAKKALELAYSQAVKDYTKARKDTEAAAVEQEWKALVNNIPVDLLALVDTKLHTVNGEWKKDGKALVAMQSGNKASHLQLPYEPGEEYDLQVTCRRVQGDEYVGLGLVAGGRQVMIFIDAWPTRGHESGVKWIDKKDVTVFKGPLLKADKDSTITCSVRLGQIDVFVNEQAITVYKGDFAHLSYPHPTPNPKALFLSIGGKKTSFQFERIVVTPVKGKGTVLK